jgi:hypothetical protein
MTGFQPKLTRDHIQVHLMLVLMLELVLATRSIVLLRYYVKLVHLIKIPQQRIRR